MKPPIIILGTHRSGTTWLGDAFSRSPEVAYWEEPRPVWVYGNWFRPDDVLTAADATPRIKRYIRRRFERFVRRHGARRLLEKTPSHCLRIPFVHAVFPEALLILLVRDGRAVLRSTLELQTQRYGLRWVWQRLCESAVWDYPAYLSRLSWLADLIAQRPINHWGVKPPGWRDWAQTDTPDVFAAKQWSATIRRALEDIKIVPETQRMVVRYEEMIERPIRITEELTAFAGIDDPAPVLSHIAATCDPACQKKWREQLSNEMLVRVKPHMEPTLRLLNYAW